MAASEDECTYSVSLSPDSLAQIRKMLDPENLLGTGCKVEKHPGACARCVRNNDCDKIPLHPHCFPAGTVVSGPRPSASVIRWYSGELVEFETRSGAVVAATPNHPVLTAQGWVGAGLLNQGDQVVREGGSQGLIVSNPDEYQQPALIEDVANSVVGRTASVAVTGESFHGDGSGSRSATVTTRDFSSGEGLEGLAGTVSLDDVIKIRRVPFNGHVYNLETRLGWYLANSIVVHNCRCRAVPYLTIGEGLGYPGT